MSTAKVGLGLRRFDGRTVPVEELLVHSQSLRQLRPAKKGPILTHRGSSGAKERSAPELLRKVALGQVDDSLRAATIAARAGKGTVPDLLGRSDSSKTHHGLCWRKVDAQHRQPEAQQITRTLNHPPPWAPSRTLAARRVPWARGPRAPSIAHSPGRRCLTAICVPLLQMWTSVTETTGASTAARTCSEATAAAVHRATCSTTSGTSAWVSVGWGVWYLGAVGWR